MTRQKVLDLYFMEARSRLIDLAAFMDRVDRGEGEGDFRWGALCEAMEELGKPGDGDRARRVLMALSDPTEEPIPVATTKAACGAWPGAGGE